MTTGRNAATAVPGKRLCDSIAMVPPCVAMAVQAFDAELSRGRRRFKPRPRSHQSRAYVERVIGTIRRERLDHVIVFNERSSHRHLQGFLAYYHRTRTHLGLQKHAPEPRPVQAPPNTRRVISIAVHLTALLEYINRQSTADGTSDEMTLVPC